MTSLLTNIAARTALQTLTQTNNSWNDSEPHRDRPACASASDNAAYWSIATTMRSDNAALSTVSGRSRPRLGDCRRCLQRRQQLDRRGQRDQEKLVAAREPGVDKAKIQSEITELQNPLQSVASGSVFSGENWLSVDSGVSGYNATKQIVSSFSRTGGAVTIGTITIDTSSVKLYDAGTAASAWVLLTAAAERRAH